MNDLMSDCHKIVLVNFMRSSLVIMMLSIFLEKQQCKALDVSEQNIGSLIVKTSEDIFFSINDMS